MEVSILLLIFLLFMLTLYVYLTAFVYSKNSSVFCPFRPKLPIGNLHNFFSYKVNSCFDFEEHYKNFKSTHKIIKFFLFTRPFYLVFDVQYIKHLLKNDFEYFPNRGFYYNEKVDFISANLFAVDEPKWSFARSKLSPAFSIGKLKMMFDVILQCAIQMRQHLDGMSQKSIDVLEISSSYTIDVIGSCAFGLDCNCFKNPDSEFKKRGKEIFECSTLRALWSVIVFTFPNFCKTLGMRLFKKSLNDFFIEITRDVITDRHQSYKERKDVIQLLMKHYQKSTNEKETIFDYKEITAQVFIFFAAGFESSSITLSYCLYELSVNIEIQNRLKNEILEVLGKHDNKITYEAVMEMKYITQIIEETLRKYPPVPVLTRKGVKTYNFPGTNHTLYKDDMILIPIIALHHDPEFFPNPEKFDPERFSAENRANIPSSVYLPFGDGPRSCIGIKLAMMQLKIALTVLLTKYSFTLDNSTVQPIPVKLYSFTLMPAEKIILDFKYLNVNN